MRPVAVLAVSLMFALGFSGCAERGGPTEEELSHMVSKTRGAISGTVVDRNNKTFDALRVDLYLVNTGERFAAVETDYDGRFYFRQLFPTKYRVSVNLKDWTDCTVTVYAGKFTNLTVSQPVFPQKPRSC